MRMSNKLYSIKQYVTLNQRLKTNSEALDLNSIIPLYRYTVEYFVHYPALGLTWHLLFLHLSKAYFSQFLEFLKPLLD